MNAATATAARTTRVFQRNTVSPPSGERPQDVRAHYRSVSGNRASPIRGSLGSASGCSRVGCLRDGELRVRATPSLSVVAGLRLRTPTGATVTASGDDGLAQHALRRARRVPSADKAEREGFEPPGPLEAGRLLSRQLHSTGLCHRSESVALPKTHAPTIWVTRLHEVFRVVLVEHVQPIVGAFRSELDDVPTRVGVNAPKIHLPPWVTDEFALHSRQLAAVVDD